MHQPYPTWIEIDLSSISSNSNQIIHDTGTPLMAIVKGDAYGPGAVQVSRAALEGGASWLGVARFGEARTLCQSGIRAPILVLGMFTPDEVDEAIASNVTLTLHSIETVQLFSARAHAARQEVRVHLKVDSGMGRLGVFAEDMVAFARQTEAVRGICIDGLYSHLGTAEDPTPVTEEQCNRFDLAVRMIEEAGLRPRWVHLANSAAAFFLPRSR